MKWKPDCAPAKVRKPVIQMIRKFIVAPEFDRFKIDRYLKRVMGYSARGLRQLDIYVNGKRLKNLDKIVRKLNRVLVVEKEKETGIVPMDIPLRVVYEDKNMLLIDKDAGIVVHPTEKKVAVTLANGLVNYFLKTEGKILVPRFFNRLDMNTTGLIIAVKNAWTQNFLQKQGKVKKYYLALAHGIIDKDEFLIDIPIGRKNEELFRQKMTPEEGGQEAKTLIRVIQRIPTRNLTLLEAELLTGRTHQIRAHLNILGHPLLGDELYGGGDPRVSRQMLHSYKCVFTVPETGETKTVEIGPPEDMRIWFQ